VVTIADPVYKPVSDFEKVNTSVMGDVPVASFLFVTRRIKQADLRHRMPECDANEEPLDDWVEEGAASHAHCGGSERRR
jgi:hypothetical protein